MWLSNIYKLGQQRDMHGTEVKQNRSVMEFKQKWLEINNFKP